MQGRVGNCRLRSILRSKRMKQQDLADRLGMSKQQVNDYVNDRIIMSLSTARRFSLALSCSIDDLYEWLSDAELRQLEE